MYRYFTTVILLLTAAVANYSISKPEAVLNRRLLEDFPKVIRDWKSVNEDHIDEEVMRVLLVDDYIRRTYVNSKGQTASLYIGYYKTQREGKQVHSPRQCLPGAGWNTVKHEEYRLFLQGHDPPKVPINVNLMGKGRLRQLYLWWYQARGRIYANEYVNKLYLIWDGITKRRTDGALVMVNLPVQSDFRETLKTGTHFISLFAPILPQYIPD